MCVESPWCHQYFPLKGKRPPIRVNTIFQRIFIPTFVAFLGRERDISISSFPSSLFVRAHIFQQTALLESFCSLPTRDVGNSVPWLSDSSQLVNTAVEVESKKAFFQINCWQLTTYVCIPVQDILVWKILCLFCLEICTGEGRKGRECKFQNKAHRTFNFRISCTGLHVKPMLFDTFCKTADRVKIWSFM